MESVEAPDEELWNFFDEGYVPSKKRAGKYIYIYLRRGQEYVSRGRYTKEKWKHIMMQYSAYKKVMGKDGNYSRKGMRRGRRQASSSKSISSIAYEATHEWKFRVDELVQREIRDLKLEYKKLKTERQILEEKLKIKDFTTQFSSEKAKTNDDEIREVLLALLGISLRELGEDADAIFTLILLHPRMFKSIDCIITILYMVEICKSMKQRYEKAMKEMVTELNKIWRDMIVCLTQQMRA